MTRGCGCDRSLRALRNNRLAASASRNADSRKSTVAPARIDRSIQVAPAALHPNVGLVDTPRPGGRFEMTSYALVEFRAIPLHPAPYGRVVSVQTTFLEQLFDISQPKRVPEIPADGAQNELGFGLPPFEDRWPGQHLGLFRLPGPVDSKLATQPFKVVRTPNGRGGPVKSFVPAGTVGEVHARRGRSTGPDCNPIHVILVYNFYDL